MNTHVSPVLRHLISSAGLIGELTRPTVIAHMRTSAASRSFSRRREAVSDARAIFLQVPDAALSLRQAAPAPAGAPLGRPVHHRGGVLQEDNRQRAHHQAPLGHVQVQ